MIARVPIDRIDPNPYQTRYLHEDENVLDLVESLGQMCPARPETSGLLQIPPARIVISDRVIDPADYGGVMATLGDESDARVQLAAGHRRHKAFVWLAQKEGEEEYTTFPVDISPLTDEQMADIAWEENAARKDISPIEEARAIRNALERFGWTQSDIARRWNLSQSAISNKLRLLHLPAAIQVMILKGKLGERHGRALLPMLELDADIDTMMSLIGPNGDEKTVRELDEAVRNYINTNTEDLGPVPWEDDWIPNPSITDDFASVATACRVCEHQVNVLGQRCQNSECFKVKQEAYRITIEGPRKASEAYEKYLGSWEKKEPDSWWRCWGCNRKISDFKGTDYADENWYKAYGYNICPECWILAHLGPAPEAVVEQEIANAPVVPAPASSPSIPAPIRPEARPKEATVPSPSRPARSSPAPPPPPLPPPKPKATLITVRILPGDVLEERAITIAIGKDGAGPTAIRSGNYAQLTEMINQMCETEFKEEEENDA